MFTSSFETWAYLHQGIFPQQGAGQGGRGAQEAGVCHFFHSLPNGQYQGGVDERHNDVGVKLICSEGEWRSRGGTNKQG